MIRTMAMAAALLCAGTAQAQLGVVQGPVESFVEKVTDADTLDVKAMPWPNQAEWRTIRIRGIDAPELRGRCQYEKDLAQAAKKFVQDLVDKNGGMVRLTVVGCDERNGGGFGRCLSYVHAGSVNITDALIERGLARENHGQARGPWCPAP